MKYIVGIITAGLLLFGCSNEEGHDGHHETHGHADHSNADDHSGHNHAEGGHDGHRHSESMGISLNNGDKWEADKHTNDKIAEMKNELGLYKNNKDYDKLTANLTNDVKELIKGCTMEGESHNQLHYWLEPFLGLVESLNNAKSADEKEVKVKEIELSLNKYSEYFK